MTDKEAIIALLRQCVEMRPDRCRAVIRDAIKEHDKIMAERAIKESRK